MLVPPLPRPRACPTWQFLRCAIAYVSTAFLARSAMPAPSETVGVILPLPAVEAYAAGAHIELGRFSPFAAEAAPRIGDAETFLVNLRERAHQRQWFVHLQIAELTDAERTAKPPPDEVWSGKGGEFRFSNLHRLAVNIRTVGPFSAGHSTRPPPTQVARMLISPDLLGLGLDESCRIMINFLAQHRGQPAQDWGAALSHDELRTLIGFAPALLEFLTTAQRTPGVREVLWQVTEKPSIWSILRRHGRIDSNIDTTDEKGWAALDPATWRLITPADVFRLPVTVRLNDQPALHSVLIVTAPHPPLLVSAGIIGIEAEPPGNPEKHLSIRIVASRRAETTAVLPATNP